MKTIFKFSTGVALDDSADYPLKYNFQIVFDGIKISIGDFYENMVTASLLPFSGIFCFVFQTDTDVCLNLKRSTLTFKVDFLIYFRIKYINYVRGM